MDAREARVALREARRWNQAGLIDDAALAQIEASYKPDASRSGDSRSAGATAVYGLAGILLGAAALALVMLLDTTETAGSLIWLGVGLAAAVGGAVLAFIRQDDLSDAFFVAALIPLTAMSFPYTAIADGLAIVSVLAPVALLATRLGRGLPPIAATAAYLVATGVAVNKLELTSFSGELIWASLATAWLVALAVINVVKRETLPNVALALAVVGLTPSYVMYLLEGFDPSFRGGIEIFLGIAMLAILMAGLAIRERGIVVGAAVVLAVDAIVFAFDVGGLALGLSVLIGTAIALLVLAATVLRRDPATA